MIRLLEQITATLEKCNIEIDDDWIKNILPYNQGFEYITKQAGLENKEGLRIYGTLSYDLDEEKIKSTVLLLLKEDMNNYYPNWIALYLVGFLGSQDAIPLLLEGIKEGRYESQSFQKYVFNSLIMLKADTSELIPLLEIAVDEYESDELKYLLMHQIMTSIKSQKYIDALEVYKSIEPFSKSKGRGFKFLIEISKSGIDTSTELYSAITHGTNWEDLQTKNIAQWYKYAHSELVNDRIFHETDLKTNGIEILCAALEDPIGWEFLKEILPDLIDEWNEKLSYGEERIKGEYITAAVTVLGALGEEVSEYLDGFYGEIGVYLSEIYSKDKRDYLGTYKGLEGEEYFEEWEDAAEDEHDYLDYEVLQKQCSLLFTYINNSNKSKFHEYTLLTKLKKMREDIFFKRIISSILIYNDNSKILSDYWVKARLSKPCTEEKLLELAKENPKGSLEFIHENFPSWGRVVPGDYLKYSIAEKNSFSLALNWDNQSLSEYLLEAFIIERKADVAQAILMVLRYKGIELSSPVALAKEKLHIGYGKNHQLTREEFDHIYPLIFNDATSQYYVNQLMWNSEQIFMDEPSLILRILRFSPKSKAVGYSLLLKVLEVENESLTSLLEETIDEQYHPIIFVVFLLYGDSEGFTFALVDGIERGFIQGMQALEIIEDAISFSTGYEDMARTVIDTFPNILSPDEMVPFFEKWCDDYDFSDVPEAICRFITDNPNKAFLPVVQKLSNSDSDVDSDEVSTALKATIEAGAVIPEKKLTITIGEDGGYLSISVKDGKFLLD